MREAVRMSHAHMYNVIELTQKLCETLQLAPSHYIVTPQIFTSDHAECAPTKHSVPLWQNWLENDFFGFCCISY